jgi:tripartite-type tricarboxylate transporter receptor subunit TctC
MLCSQGETIMHSPILKRGTRLLLNWCRRRNADAGRTLREYLACAAIAVHGLLLTTVHVQAQPYPVRPIRLVVGFAPGGANDIVGRILAQKLTDVLGHQVVVDNRAGADGRIATAMVAKSQPDGYTILLVPASFSYGTAGLKDPPYTHSDFSEVSLVAKAPFILLATPGFPASTVKELIAVAKTSSQPFSYGTGGVGNLTHLAGELFRQMAGINLRAVAYRGTGPAMVDLMGGQIPLQVAAILSAVPFVTSGKVKAFGVTALKRSSAVPEVPTISEAGLPGYEAEGWWAILGPRDTSAQALAVLNKSINVSLSAPDVNDQLNKVGATAAPTTSQSLRRFIKNESVKWVKVIKEARIELH